MSSPDTFEGDGDPVDALLSAGRCSGTDDRLRQAVLGRTIGVVRRRRRLKRVALGAALLGCYLVGVATTQLSRSPTGRTVGPLAQQRGGPRASAQPTPRPSRVVPQPQADLPAGRCNGRIAKVRQADFDDIRRLSDRYLEREGNVTLALRYYARALNTASAEQRAISVEEDSWLLMALKQARLKEIRHDNGDS